MDEVLVVGARTTGLMMASELARRGVPTRCIDKSPGIDPHVRANLLHPRTLEIFQGLGLDEKVTVGSVPEKALVFYRNGARVGENPHTQTDSPYPFGMSQSQTHTEATLQDHLNSFGVNVERNVALTSLEQDEDGVTVALQHRDTKKETCRFQWVIGCDGAHSAVRHCLGLAFPGEPDEIPYILGDVSIAGDDDLEPHKAHIFFHEDGDLYFFTRLPGNRHFVVGTLKAGAAITGAPSLEELQDIVAKRAMPSLRLGDPRWLGYFRINYRLAPRYRQERVFLAGDATHVHSLLGGQGMNTGIQDSHNLAWKLALVAKREARAEILDNYEVERRGVADDVIEVTRQVTDAMESYMSLSQQEQDKFVSLVLTQGPEQLDADRHSQEIDLNYGESKLTLATEDVFDGGPAPGTRAPDATDLTVAGNSTSFFKIPTDKGYRLFFFCGETSDVLVTDIKAAVEASSRFAVWLKPYIVRKGAGDEAFGEQTVILDQNGNMHRKFAASNPCIYLIRPDGYVAYRSSDLSSVGKYFEHLAVFDELTAH